MNDAIKEESNSLWKNESEHFVNNLLSVESKLQILWQKIGMDSAMVSKRVVRVFAILNEVLDEMLNEESNLLDSLEKKVKNYEKKINHLNNDLHMPQELIEQSETLLLQEHNLKEIINDLENKKQKAMTEWKQLDVLSKTISKRLASQAHEIQLSGIPTRAQIGALIEFTNSVEKELKAREAKFLVLKNELINIINDMEYSINDDFLSSAILPNSETNFILSCENINKLTEWKDRLEKDLIEIKNKINRLWDSIEFLWSSLNIEKIERDFFKQTNHNYTPTVYENLKNEENRLKKLRLENLSDYIPKLKEELIVSWNKCRFGSQKREQFVKVFGAQISEESLTAHEDALLSAKQYYSTNHKILQLLEKRDEMWDNYRKFETNNTNIDRYQNRGGALLKEEKLRRNVYRELPKTEKELSILVTEWESKNGSSFLIDDMTYLEYLSSQSQSLQEEKETRKKFRQLSRTPATTPTKKGLNSTAMNTTKLNSTMCRSRNCATERVARVKKIQHAIPLTPIKRRSSFIWPNDNSFMVAKNPKHINLYDNTNKQVNVLLNSNAANVKNFAIVSPIFSKPDIEEDKSKKRRLVDNSVLFLKYKFRLR
ncbi:hypothetical protein HZS_1351 [Henneguya salminicola]|nr:hypothetical protein HZS_1351 [Henneguya salminicola]